MPTEMKLWRIDKDQPKPIDPDTLDLESRLEDWIRKDIGMVNDDLLVIGQQVKTAYGGIIDLLALDSDANLVILELKRDMTPREVVAQTLDYASWVQGLTAEAIGNLAANFFGGDRTLEQAFREKFDEDVPEFVNQAHRMYIVASSLDSATERIIEYLSETHSVNINAATFAYFKTPDNGEMIGRYMLLNEEAVEERATSKKSWRAATEEELEAIAVKNKVGDLWKKAYEEFNAISRGRKRQKDSLLFRVRIDGSIKWFVKMYPTHSSQERGLAISLHRDRIHRYFDLSLEKLAEICKEEIGSLWSAFYFDGDRLDKLIELLKENAPEG